MQHAGTCLLHDGQSVDCGQGEREERQLACPETEGGREENELQTHLDAELCTCAPPRLVQLAEHARALRRRNVGRAELAPHDDLRRRRPPHRAGDLLGLGVPAGQPRLLERRPGSTASRSVEHGARGVQLEAVELRAVRLDPALDAHVGADEARRGEAAREGDRLDVARAVDVGAQELEAVVAQAEEDDGLEVGRRERLVAEFLQERDELRAERRERQRRGFGEEGDGVRELGRTSLSERNLRALIGSVSSPSSRDGGQATRTHLRATATRSLRGRPISSTSSRQSLVARNANMARTHGVSTSDESERHRAA